MVIPTFVKVEKQFLMDPWRNCTLCSFLSASLKFDEDGDRTWEYSSLMHRQEWQVQERGLKTKLVPKIECMKTVKNGYFFFFSNYTFVHVR